MLLIFDLDDTLIDTTSLLTSMKLTKALQKMVDAGLKVGDYPKAEEMLLRMNQGAKATKELLLEFVELYGGNGSHYDIGLNEVEKIDLHEYDIPPATETIQFLNELKDDYLLALVTRGREKMQKEKLNAFGIDETLFCDIVITPYFDKGDHYKKIVSKRGIYPSEVMVIGDRIDADLLGAKEMGATTVHIRKGRGANLEIASEIVDYTIYELQEIFQILELQDKPLEMV